MWSEFMCLTHLIEMLVLLGWKITSSHVGSSSGVSNFVIVSMDVTGRAGNLDDSGGFQQSSAGP